MPFRVTYNIAAFRKVKKTPPGEFFGLGKVSGSGRKIKRRLAGCLLHIRAGHCVFITMDKGEKPSG
ncbi:MAG TPA: hypothetical protein DEA44_05150 [Firmicutes bacterium]|nr:hypothetical protein [Bacillota bacterium]